ncbi:MAG: ornithine carbamoyltransferase [Planctomycetaceae bacterium]
MKHVISLFDFNAGELRKLFELASELKARLLNGERPALLPGRVLTQVFEKPSLRTRVSFEAAIIHLGGTSIFLSGKDAGLHGRESLPDVARVLTDYSDAVVLRTFSHELIQEFSEYSSCPVINGLSDRNHPCQALTDIFTIQEVFGADHSRKIVFVGDGNNVANSLAVAAALLKIPFTLAAPEEYQLPDEFLAQLELFVPGAEIEQTADPHKAVRDAGVIYTDVWASMGQESEREERKKVFAPYQVNAKLFQAAPGDCRFMHCLPAHRGEEVTDDIIDGPQSLVFPQAENRMHLAKGLLVWLLGEVQGPGSRVQGQKSQESRDKSQVPEEDRDV